MKKYLFVLMTFLFFIPVLNAQEKKDREKMKEEIQQFKVDFLAKEMELSEKEKAQFAPIYKEYDSERRAAGAEAWNFERQLKKKKDATDADYKKLSELQQKARENGDRIEKKYQKQFESFLSAKQIYAMHKGEEKFFTKMKEMRKKHGKDPKGKKDKHRHQQDKDRAELIPGDFPPPPPHFDMPDF